MTRKFFGQNLEKLKEEAIKEVQSKPGEQMELRLNTSFIKVYEFTPYNLYIHVFENGKCNVCQGVYTQAPPLNAEPIPDYETALLWARRLYNSGVLDNGED